MENGYYKWWSRRQSYMRYWLEGGGTKMWSQTGVGGKHEGWGLVGRRRDLSHTQTKFMDIHRKGPLLREEAGNDNRICYSFPANDGRWLCVCGRSVSALRSM